MFLTGSQITLSGTSYYVLQLPAGHPDSRLEEETRARSSGSFASQD